MSRCIFGTLRLSRRNALCNKSTKTLGGLGCRRRFSLAQLGNNPRAKHLQRDGYNSYGVIGSGHVPCISHKRHFSRSGALRSAKDAPSVLLQEINKEVADLIYSSLTTEHGIRLVKLHPAVYYSEAIKCSLLTVDLKTAPPYEALSYVWGKLTAKDIIRDEDPMSKAARDVSRVVNNANARSKGWDIDVYDIKGSEIELEGRPYFITRNLNEALRRLRNPSTDRFLWIDALAINQSDIPERNSQVRKMLEIYATAAKTIIWLGKFGLDDLKMEAYLNELFRTISRIDMTDYSVVTEFMDGLSVEQVRTIFHAAAALSFNPYFTRAWTFQESVASNEIMLLHDKYAVEMTALTNLLRVIRDTIDEVEEKITSQGLEGDMQILLAFATIRRLPIKSLQPQGLSGNIPSFDFTRWTEEFIALRDCENPRDRVFAAYALFPPEVRGMINVDYARRVEDVYIDISRAFIRREGLFVRGRHQPL
ncbi:hypothetical protein VTL71DRAFT_1455 [Oculimacula yallundae]|uniref:Heterokaryon incompatibility domain-containing protein n=1 Tax=Oculimacula yallundae TaxID=86028 RepID=A0ABR4CAS8_9HELO